MSNGFNSQILEEKLSKLNNSQQSIETLSQWCILHRKKANHIVETWEKYFNNSPNERRIPFLYLANDILQNSRRKGSEFVNEFWKVLAGAMKSVYANGNSHGKHEVIRLVTIWDERKVFGSRGRGLKEEIFGNEPLPVLENSGKSSQSIKIVKKDSHSMRVKLAVGGMLEKIVTAYQPILDEHLTEDTTLNKCKSTASLLEKMQKDVDDACTQDHQNVPHVLNNLQEQETILKQCVEKLENVQASRAALILLLKDALHEQESRMELVSSHLQVAKNETEHLGNLKHKLNLLSVALNMPVQPATSMATSMSSATEDNKKTAAAIAAKLAASTSSAQMLVSALSTLVAEEAASVKKPKLETPVPAPMPEMANPYVVQGQQQQPALNPLMVQINQIPQFAPPPPPLPPRPPPPGIQQFNPPSSGPMFGMPMPPPPPFTFGGNVIPPPPPLSSHPLMSVPRSIPPLPLLPPPPQQQQQSVQAGFHPPQGIGFYGQPQTAPASRQ